MEQSNVIYRVTVSGLHCRSSVELVNLKVSAIEGVQAASISPEHVLTVFADAELVSASDIVRALIDAGVLPDGGVSTHPLEAVEAAIHTEAEAHDEPVLAEVEQVDEPVLAEVEESIRADIETPHVAVSPRASLVQRIRVAVLDDYYPNLIEVIPGVPVDLEFSEGHGCLARVVFDEFDIDEDLTDGGAIVSLPGLTPGTHEFTCGMRMVRGAVVARI